MYILGILLLVVSSTTGYYCPSKIDKDQIPITLVTNHGCGCNDKTAGTLRYHRNKIQFCNGKEYVDLGGSGGKIGSEDNPGKSCSDILSADKKAASGSYYLKAGDHVTKTYCYMGEICGSKGWAMIMKVDGKKSTFKFDSGLWSDKQVYNKAGADSGLGEEETKLSTYYNLPFTKLCLGMKTSGNIKWLRLDYEAHSLYSVIHDKKYRATHIGRNAWKNLIPGSSLQRNCNKEGFNVYHGNNAMARIGIITNEQNDCNSPDSRLGIGTAGTHCGQDNSNSAGNEGRCSADNGDKSIKGFAYVFAQGRLESAPVGSYDNPASSCKAIHAARSDSKNGEYYLRLGSKVEKTYCLMDDVCGSKGWSLIMKVNGGKTTFSYNSHYWTDDKTYQVSGTSGGLDDKETKLQTYSDLPFNALCLGMKTGGITRWLKIPQKATSLHSLIAGNKELKTHVGRNAWKNLIPGSSLQKHCNKEGFNVYHNKEAMARIGIIANEQNDCNSPDSRLGIGTAGTHCGQDNNNSAGNEGRCSADNGNKSIKVMAYIFAQ